MFDEEIVSRLPILSPDATSFETFLDAGAVFLTLRLQHSLPRDLIAAFAAAVA